MRPASSSVPKVLPAAPSVTVPAPSAETTPELPTLSGSPVSASSAPASGIRQRLTLPVTPPASVRRLPVRTVIRDGADCVTRPLQTLVPSVERKAPEGPESPIVRGSGTEMPPPISSQALLSTVVLPFVLPRPLPCVTRSAPPPVTRVAPSYELLPANVQRPLPDFVTPKVEAPSESGLETVREVTPAPLFVTHQVCSAANATGAANV